MNSTAKIVYTPHEIKGGGRPVNALECNMEDTLLRLGYGRMATDGKADHLLLPFMRTNKGLFKRGFRWGTTISGRPKITDFIISTKGEPILVEAKMQESRGTAYEKVPYSIQNLQATGLPWILVYDGRYIPEILMDDQRKRTKADPNCYGIYRFEHFENFLRSLA